MSHHIGSMIADGLTKTSGYAKMLVEDIPAERFSERGAPNMNHPTWIMGHLALYPNRALATAGRADLVVEQDGWEELFSFKSTCDDDTGQYPGKDEVVAAFMDRCRVAAEALPTIDDDVFTAALPEDHPMAARMDTVGQMVNFILVAHPMLHLGQLSSWRRALAMDGVMNRK